MASCRGCPPGPALERCSAPSADGCPGRAGRCAWRGSTSEIVVDRDRWGIPHVEANSDADAWFALGFCHGQDRSFQLELIARAGRGRLAELLGPGALPIDRLSRTLGFHRLALAQVQTLDADVLDTISAYVSGINAARASSPRPHELVLLRAKPSTWNAEDVLAFDGLQSLALGGNWDTELARLAILDADGPEALGGGRAALRRVAAGRHADGWTCRRAARPPRRRPLAPARPGWRARRLERLGRRRTAVRIGCPDPRQRPAPRPGDPSAVVPRAPARAGVGAGRRLVRWRTGIRDRLQRPRGVGHHRRLHRLVRPLLGGALRRRADGARARWPRAGGAHRRVDPGARCGRGRGGGPRHPARPDRHRRARARRHPGALDASNVARTPAGAGLPRGASGARLRDVPGCVSVVAGPVPQCRVRRRRRPRRLAAGRGPAAPTDRGRAASAAGMGGRLGGGAPSVRRPAVGPRPAGGIRRLGEQRAARR